MICTALRQVERRFTKGHWDRAAEASRWCWMLWTTGRTQWTAGGGKDEWGRGQDMRSKEKVAERWPVLIPSSTLTVGKSTWPVLTPHNSIHPFNIHVLNIQPIYSRYLMCCPRAVTRIQQLVDIKAQAENVSLLTLFTPGKVMVPTKTQR